MNTYSERLKDPRWQKKRLRIMERDGFKCVLCDRENEQLQIHHCLYGKGDPWETSDEFLITLCKDCHEDRHILESKIKKNFTVILARHTALHELNSSLEKIISRNDKNQCFLFNELQAMEQVDEAIARDRAERIEVVL